jgi:glutathione S-transferase
MSDIKVLSVPGSPYGRAVLVALEEKHAVYRVVPVAPKTLRSPEHLARHPFGRIPVLEHGDFRLYETQAILRYLDRVLPGLTLTPPEPSTTSNTASSAARDPSPGELHALLDRSDAAASVITWAETTRSSMTTYSSGWWATSRIPGP